jgi:hypothetical protein
VSSPSTSRESEADAARARGDLLGAWRVDVTSSAWPILIPATVLTGIGVLGVGAAFVSHGPFAHNETLTFIGSVSMVAGPLVAIIGMRQLLKHDEYIAAHAAGVLLVLDGTERFLPWRDLAGVHWRGAPGVLTIEQREGEAIVIEKPFGMIKGPDLAAKLEDLRRRAAFNLPL